VNDYGVWGEKLFMGRIIISTYRTTFLINEKGKIDHIIEKVVSKNHSAQILETWGLA
jgi:peroxiredoxin Q/BCP